MSARELLHPNVFNFYTLPDGGAKEVRTALDVLTPARLDVMARYIYIRARITGIGLQWGTYVYRNLLESWNPTFYDGDGKKSCFPDYLKRFDELIESFQRSGFESGRSLVPYTGDTIIDGGHRLACALYFKTPVETIAVSGERQVQDAATLLRIGMDPVVVEQMVSEYVRLDKNCYAAILFPVGAQERFKVEECLKADTTIIYQKDISLSAQGQFNFIDLLYAHEEWWNPIAHSRFVAERFTQSAPATLYFLKFPEGKEPRPTKEKVRALFGIGNHPMHINDTHGETVAIADAVLSRNGLHQLNIAQPKPLPKFAENLALFRAALAAKPELAEAVCIDLSSVLAVYGYRDLRDVDYISAKGERVAEDCEAFGLHNTEYPDFPIPLDEVIANPNYHFRYKGLKFMSLPLTLMFKWSRNTPKDLQDCALLMGRPLRLPDPLPPLPPRIPAKVRLKNAAHRVFAFGVITLKLLLPRALYNRLRDDYRAKKAAEKARP